MITLYDLLNLIDLDAELEVLDNDGYLLQEGRRGETMWNNDLLDRQVYLVHPGIVTKIFLEDWFMFLIGVSLTIIGIIIGFIGIYKAARNNNLEESLSLLCYVGIFLAMIGAILIGSSL